MFGPVDHGFRFWENDKFSGVAEPIQKFARALGSSRLFSAMDAALKRHSAAGHGAGAGDPPLLGSAFNIWYNMTVVDPLLNRGGVEATLH